MDTAGIVLSLFHEIDVDGSHTIDLEKFKAFLKSGRIGKELASLPEKEVETMFQFQLIDEDGSEEIYFQQQICKLKY